MKDVLFDGKWSFTTEWKQSSLTRVQTDSGQFYIRSAHWENDIYVLVDVLIDHTPTNEDFAVLCVNPEPSKNSTNFSQSFCFKTFLNNEAFSFFNSETFSVLKWNNDAKSFVEAYYHENIIAMGKTSDENDRYDARPHPTYEFKIPLEPLGRYDRYGFFVGVYDSEKSTSFSSQEDLELDLSVELPSPSSWGEIFSPDKSLPEYPIPILVLGLTVMVVILLSLKNRVLFVTNKIHQ